MEKTLKNWPFNDSERAFLYIDPHKTHPQRVDSVCECGRHLVMFIRLIVDLMILLKYLQNLPK
jgi:hypothetical protein